MSADLKPYPAMKDSGVQWLGKVPAHWEVRHLGRIGRFFKGGGGTKEDEREDGIPCIRYGDLYTYHRFFITASRACVAPDLAATVYTPIRYGDVLFAGSGETIDEIGKSAVNLIRGPAYCGGDVIIFRPSIDAEARFLGYAADCSASVHQKACIGRGFTVMHIYSTDLKYMAVAIPPVPEQAAIVRFLDHADRRIRRYLRAKQQLVMLLEEQKQAVVHEALTGRIDVRTGQPYPAMKDSGVQWLGKVPAHWEVAPVKQHYAIRLGKMLQPARRASDDCRISYLKAKHVQWFEVRTNDIDTMWATPDEVDRYGIVAGDLLVCEGGEGGRCGIVKHGTALPDPCIIQNALHRVRPRRWGSVGNISRNDYLQYMMSTVASAGWFDVLTDKATIAHFTAKKFGALLASIPPLPEQAAIVSFLDRATADLDAATTSAQRETSLIRAYHTHLIADVVTGKFDVREAAARLPEEVEEPEPLDETDALIEDEDGPTDNLDTAIKEAEV